MQYRMVQWHTTVKLILALVKIIDVVVAAALRLTREAFDFRHFLPAFASSFQGVVVCSVAYNVTEIRSNGFATWW